MLEARIAGIPCLLEVTHYLPRIPGRYSGPPESCYPDEGAEVEFVVLDRRGRPAPWLERKLTASARDTLESQVIAHLEG